MTRKDKIFLSLGILNPIAYEISPNLLIICIIFELFLIFKSNEEFKYKFWKAYLLAFSYFGVSILSFKLYDLIVMFFLPKLIFIKIKKIGINKAKYLYLIICYFIYITISLLFNFETSIRFPEYLRYVQSFIVVFVACITIKDIKEFFKLNSFFRILAIKNILTGIVMAILSLNNVINYRYSSKFLSVSIHEITIEFRVTGFFSDPNKYFLYFVFLLTVYELYLFIYKRTYKIFDKTNIIFIFGMVISLSRTAMLSVICFVMLKFIHNKLLKNDKKLNVVFSILLIIGSSVTIVFLGRYLMEGISDGLNFIAQLLGREHTMSISNSLLEDSRIVSSKFALNSVKDSWFFGNGLASWDFIYYMPPHNTIVTVIQDTGVIGLVLFSLVCIYPFKYIPLYISIPLFFMPLFTLDLQNYRLFYLIATLIVIYSGKNRKIDMEIEEYEDSNCRAS